jgi:hypothetical protein
MNWFTQTLVKTKNQNYQFIIYQNFLTAGISHQQFYFMAYALEGMKSVKSRILKYENATGNNSHTQTI